VFIKKVVAWTLLFAFLGGMLAYFLSPQWMDNKTDLLVHFIVKFVAWSAVIGFVGGAIDYKLENRWTPLSHDRDDDDRED